MNGLSSPDLLAQIEDIKGLDTVGWWPLAPVWWVLLAVILSALVVALGLYLRRRAYEHSWKGEAKRALALLQSRLDDNTAHEIAGALSTMLRRIAMQRYSREACAGLEGNEWLAWLQKNDPRGFDWKERGAMLTEIYAPPVKKGSPEKVRMLIEAAQQWVA